ncbi:MAG TPA: peptidoglycan bridge formation glycyltransferase FemA/FemB family protein [Candidatus Limnocylindrales bacterium]|nr:peptidoglycan bridge formation glycyltransferase FemA/FemB family protein [Candidatus Limnocylindrales bacterium]
MTSPELRAWRVTDPAAWNAFAERAPYHAFPQLWEWGQVRAMGGWRPVRLAIGPSQDHPVAGAQLLLRRMPVLGWHLAYVPRGPIGDLDDPAVRGALASALRALGAVEKIATVRADPEARPDTPYGRALLEAPWRAAPKIQPPTTRVIDLTAGEDALKAALKRKHRQYVNKAERGGVTIERFDGASPAEVIGPALADFNRIYQFTAERAGFVARQGFYYERVWSIFAPTGRVRLSFALLDGERVATIFHFTCGDRAVEAYGGMTDAGADARANYLLKWAAIADFAREGFKVYDMWGLATGGIRQFKEGFGGEEIEYVGARDLSLRAPMDLAMRLAIPAYGLAQRARLRLLGRDGGTGATDVG